MAPKKKVVENKLNVALLASINSGQVTRISQADAVPLLQATPPLIVVDTGNIVDGAAIVTLTEAGKHMVDASQNAAEVAPVASPYAIIKNADLPPSKRGGRAGAPTVYPFATMEIGDKFFVPKSAKHPDPVKTLGSVVSNANMKFADEVKDADGATLMKTVTRTKRGPKNKALLDEAGNKMKETVQVPVYKQTRKFVIRAVQAGTQYGSWTADADGALIARVPIE